MTMDISVIVPVYNVEKYIWDCLQSVANQTKTVGVECILVDDKGTDNSMGIVEEFVSSYNGFVGFRILHHEENKGLSAARNTGIKAAKGKYLFFLDSDDTVMPCCLELLQGLAEQYGADMVQGSYKSESPYLLQMENVNLPLFSNDESFVKRTLLNYDCVPVMAQNRMVKKQVVLDSKLYFKEGIIHEDLYWNFFLAKAIRRIVFCKERTYFYRLNPNSITNKINLSKESQSFKTIITDFCENIDAKEKKIQLKYIFCSLLRAIESKFYATEKDKEQLLSCCKKQVGIMGRLWVGMIFWISPRTWIRGKLVNLYMKTLSK